MNPAAVLMLLAACLALVACGERRDPPPVDETVFRDQVRALEKARSVEELAEERKRELDRHIDSDTYGDD